VMGSPFTITHTVCACADELQRARTHPATQNRARVGKREEKAVVMIKFAMSTDPI